MEYMLIEYVDAGFRSGEERHKFNSIEEAHAYIKKSRMPVRMFKLYEVNEIPIELPR